jgi:hypothetical protein
LGSRVSRTKMSDKGIPDPIHRPEQYRYVDILSVSRTFNYPDRDLRVSSRIGLSFSVAVKVVCSWRSHHLPRSIQSQLRAATSSALNTSINRLAVCPTPDRPSHVAKRRDVHKCRGFHGVAPIIPVRVRIRTFVQEQLPIGAPLTPSCFLSRPYTHNTTLHMI